MGVPSSGTIGIGAHIQPEFGENNLTGNGNEADLSFPVSINDFRGLSSQLDIMTDGTIHVPYEFQKNSSDVSGLQTGSTSRYFDKTSSSWSTRYGLLALDVSGIPMDDYTHIYIKYRTRNVGGYSTSGTAAAMSFGCNNSPSAGDWSSWQATTPIYFYDYSSGDQYQDWDSGTVVESIPLSDFWGDNQWLNIRADWENGYGTSSTRRKTIHDIYLA